MIDRKLFRFLLVGLGNTVVGLGAIYFAMHALGWSTVPSNAFGYTCGLILSFLLNRNWTFKHDGAHGPAMLRFMLVTGVAYAANLLVVLGAEHFGASPDLAQPLGTPFYTACSYLGSRYFAFRAQPVT
jgi:putative flippase GtrA